VSKAPSLNGGNGRDRAGRFSPGNPGGPGNPQTAAVNRLRAELLRAVTPDVIRKVVNALIRKAESGDVAACRELLDRTMGKPPSSLDIAAAITPAPIPLSVDGTPLDYASIIARARAFTKNQVGEG